MKNLIYFYLVFGCLTSMAQTEWAPIGAKWYYNQPSSESGNFVVFEALKDSVIQGKNVRVIEINLNGSDLVSRECIMQSSDSIFYYNSNSNTFNLLYDFSAKVGDTIVVHKNMFKPTEGFFSNYDSIPNFKYKITSIDSIQINSIWLKRQKIISADSEWNFFNGMSSEMFLIDKIGSLTYFFGRIQYIIPEEQPSLLRCYIDSEIDYKNAQWDRTCDFLSGNYSHQTIEDIMLFPNPANNILRIRSNEIIEIVEIYDARGSKCFFDKPRNRAFSLDLSELDKGVFIVILRTTQKIYLRKFVKQ